ncbi:ABC transporter ATP-binding protein [Ramlibacter algicola]|uniref:ATP-binding cassette domain-containing protein n=1 Tax=Ramlibacter algicola TaxID=2795217 RepID=A0A934URC2_9BURK|nr:ABC transporter transmembrane domain-containing protein [Ramlibacter algicola]MBK0392377.1 ATP-binding cassette domain-containing protein [Ramlibacter algicola]
MPAESIAAERAAHGAPTSRRDLLGESTRLLVRAARPDKHHFWWAVLWLVAAAALEALGPLIGKFLIDHYLLPRHAAVAQIGALLAGALVAGMLSSWLRYLQLLRLAGLAMRSVQRVREEVYAHVLRLPMAFFDRAITGQLVSRVTNDTEAVKTLYVQVLFVMLDSVIVLVGAAIAMLWLDWRLMLAVLVLLPAVVVIVAVYQRLSAPAVTRTRELRSELNAQMAESIAGMPVLQAANATDRFRGRFAGLNESHYASRQVELRANAWLLRPMLDLLNVVLLAAVIGMFGLRIQGGALGTIEVGVLYAFVSYIARVVEPLTQITMQFSQLQQAMVGAARVHTLLKEAETPEAPPQAEVREGGIRIEQLTFAYQPGRPVLHDVDLTIAPGSFWGIVGHTGSGKSTLLSLLLRFYPAPAGSIRIDGAPLDQIGEDHLRDRVGLVPQEPFLLAATARENITMGRPISEAQVEAAARAAQAHDFILGLERGYDTPLGEGGARLSVGQKQLIAIARALAGDPRILFLDEATANIDSETEQVVQRALASLRGKVTIVAIAHRLSTVREADTIVVLNHGRVAELGTHDALMQVGGGIYRRLYELQQLEDQDEPDGAGSESA